MCLFSRFYDDRGCTHCDELSYDKGLETHRRSIDELLFIGGVLYIYMQPQQEKKYLVMYDIDRTR